MEKILNIVFPEKCIFCKQTYGSVLCDKCLLTARFLDSDYCIYCEKLSINGVTHSRCIKDTGPDQIISVFLYQGIVRGCIKFAKYKSKEFLALKKLSRYCADYFYRYNFDFSDFVVVPIPVSKKRYKSRGFNQAQLISEIVAKKLKIKHQNSILTRTLHKPAQYKGSRIKRFENVKNVFKVNGKVSSNILLVDDICTTGATLLEASSVLKKAGAKKVFCFTIAKKF